MGRPKKTVDTDAKSIDLDALINTKTSTDSNSEFEELKKQMATMMVQMQKLTQENTQLKAKANSNSQIETNDIDADTTIPVVSLTTGTLVVSTLGNGLGTVYRFENFGEVQDIPFSDLKDIVKNKPNFAREGAYYIDDENAVKKLRLERQYQNILSEDDIKRFFKGTADNAVKIYNNMTPMQKHQIVSLIEDKIQKKESIDANILVSIGKLANKDFLYRDVDAE
jgi:hypothetical protein